MVRTVEWRRGRVVMIDQRLLPGREVYRVYRDSREVARAIRDMVVRGAPAIGVAAAMAVALGARRLSERNADAAFERMCRALLHTRPTAVNLAWAIERMRRVYREHRGGSMTRLRERLEREAQAIHDEDIVSNRQLGRHGAALLPDEGTVLTYCNAGALATAGYGTALGIIRRAREIGKRISVVACETRPYLQGARLTAWELLRDRIPCTLVTDNMVGHLMQQGAIDAVIVGTDRTVANGDVANKIGTYTIAVLARRHGVPFYVAAPLSSVDLRMGRGADIPIEERSPEELTQIGGTPLAPRGVRVFHPAFDVTPSRLITAIVTERGVVRPPYRKSLARVVRAAAQTGRERERR